MVYLYKSPLDKAVVSELVETVKLIVAPGKGILAADESTGTIMKRFEAAKIECTESNRCAYRSLLFTTPGMEKYISGVILYEETLFQKDASGRKLVDMLREKGIVPGIKVDQGLVSLLGTDSEQATQGMDGLGKRCKEYYEAGARFAKWRCVLKIGDGLPSELSIKETAHSLARYASICQESRLVPIVEPEILSDGAHDIERCAFETERTLAAVFKALNDYHVVLEGALLKPNMVTAGVSCPVKGTSNDVGIYTVRALQRTCPPALGGVVFLSGGQSEEESSMNLNSINSYGNLTGRKPWPLTFSFGRALQASAIKVWSGKPENMEAAQAAYMACAKANGEASLGKYVSQAPNVAGESLHVKNYIY